MTYLFSVASKEDVTQEKTSFLVVPSVILGGGGGGGEGGEVGEVGEEWLDGREKGR